MVEVTIVEAVKADGITISSTNIRKQIQKGKWNSKELSRMLLFNIWEGSKGKVRKNFPTYS